MLRHAWWVAPAGGVVGFLLAGPKGAAGVAVGVLLAFLNFAASALILSRTARVSLPALQAGALFGFLLRLGCIAVALVLLRRIHSLDFAALGLALCLGHLAFMTVEARYLGRAMSLADHPVPTGATGA
jgi:hypothetical protein